MQNHFKEINKKQHLTLLTQKLCLNSRKQILTCQIIDSICWPFDKQTYGQRVSCHVHINSPTRSCMHISLPLTISFDESLFAYVNIRSYTQWCQSFLLQFPEAVYILYWKTSVVWYFVNNEIWITGKKEVLKTMLLLNRSS